MATYLELFHDRENLGFEGFVGYSPAAEVNLVSDEDDWDLYIDMVELRAREESEDVH